MILAEMSRLRSRSSDHDLSGFAVMANCVVRGCPAAEQERFTIFRGADVIPYPATMAVPS